MEGSIADSTALRIRSQLQRTHHSAPAGNAEGFLEELLRMPVAAQIDAHDETEAEVLHESEAPVAAIGPGTDSGEPKPEDDQPDQPSADEPLMPVVVVCYGPAPIAVPDNSPPVSQHTPDQPAAAAEPVAATTDQVQVAAPVVAPSQSAPEVSDQAAPVAATEATDSDEVVATVTDPLPIAAQNSPANVLRENRRIREPREKNSEPQQPRLQPTKEVAVNQPASSGPDEHVEPGQPVAKSAQPLEQTQVGDQPSQPAGSRSRDDGPRQREKWYDAERNHSTAAALNDRGQTEQASLAGRQLEQATGSSSGMLPGANLAELASASETISALATDTQVMPPDGQQLANDMSAALQASQAQVVRSTTVTEATSAAAADAGSRNRPGGSATGASVSPTSGSSGSARSAGASSPPADTSEQSSQISQQERVRLVQRVARSFSRLGPEGGQVSLKLHPPQLGVLNVSIKIEGQTLTARLQTETTAARDVIVDNLPVLRDRLSEHGIEVEKFQVEVGQQEDFASGNGQSGTFSGGQSEPRNSQVASEYQYRRTVRGDQSRPPAVPPMEPKLQAWSAADRSLDVRA